MRWVRRKANQMMRNITANTFRTTLPVVLEKVMLDSESPRRARAL